LVVVVSSIDEVRLQSARLAEALLATHPLSEVQVEHWAHRVAASRKHER
jgi:hypothetical protein